MKNLKTVAVTLLLLLFILPAQAQLRNKIFWVSAAVGVTNYKGDIDDNFSPKFSKPGFGVMAGYKFHPHMSLRLGFQQGWMGADDKSANRNNKVLFVPIKKTSGDARYRRNLHFRTPISELSLTVMYDFFANTRRYKFRPKWSPYIFAGVAGFIFNPQAKLNGKWENLQPMGTEGQFLPDCPTCPKPYKLIQISIPMGIGVKYKLTKKIDIALEVGLRKTFTDYIDDVSGLYPPMDKLLEWNPKAYLLSDRIDRSIYPQGAGGNYDELGNELGVNGIRGHRGFGQQDWYAVTVLTATYILDWVRCPKFR